MTDAKQLDFQSYPCHEHPGSNHPDSKLRGSIEVQGDKSLSHRALILGALADSDVCIKGFLASLDCLATMNALQQLGVSVTENTATDLVIHGVGVQGLKSSEQPLDLGNSGTSIRLLTGVLAGQTFASTLTGDVSLQTRPMARIIKPLTAMGANIVGTHDNTPPLNIIGHQPLNSIEYHLPVASAQLKSCLLLANLYAQGEMILHEKSATRDHTERLLQAMGCEIEKQGLIIHMRGGQQPKAIDICIPGDFSSAAFFIVAATIAEQADIVINNVGVNPTRIGLIHLLKQMGANITLLNQREISGEPVADIHVTSAKLHGITIDKQWIANAIDEMPILFIAAACAQGITTLTNASELRVKESDRIKAMAEGMITIGCQVEELADGMIIHGGEIRGGRVNSFADHRIAMAFAIAGSVSSLPIIIENCNNVATSFPGFIDLTSQIGLNIEENYE